MNDLIAFLALTSVLHSFIELGALFHALVESFIKGYVAFWEKVPIPFRIKWELDGNFIWLFHE